MVLATHALVGAAIGEKINNPWIIVVASLAVHYFLDSFRHGEYFDSRTATIRNTAWKVALDIAISFSIIAFFIFSRGVSGNELYRIMLGVFVSMLPDGLTLMFWKFNFPFMKKLQAFHGWAHHYSKFPKFSPERQWTLRNAANDIIFSLIAIIVIFLK
jgi:hypothetical protein